MWKNNSNIKAKRIYDTSQAPDGFRILIDRLWPRGIKKVEANVDLWLKEIAPSESLRKWFNHDPQKWTEFKSLYFKELDSKPNLIEQITAKSQASVVTLLYSAKNEKYNNAIALLEYLSEERM